uniref:B30.2/SPRY domain-containing protein n=1 Tax=Neogobius melanostomus TaxID=47308 RepID=A0A8C6UQH7_9GOBI
MEQNMEEEEVRGRKDDRALTSDQASGWSRVSLKSDFSKGEPPNFSPGPGPDSQSQSGVSHVSLKSDFSKGEPLNFSPDPGPDSQSQSGVSHVSLKSDFSKGEPLNFSPDPETRLTSPGPRRSQRSDSGRHFHASGGGRPDVCQRAADELPQTAVVRAPREELRERLRARGAQQRGCAEHHHGLPEQDGPGACEQKLDNVDLSAERSLNLLHCLNELEDRSLVKQVQKLMSEGGLSDRDMSPAQWSAMSYILLSSNSDLQHFDLRKYCPTEKGLLGLLLVVKASTKATLRRCGLSPRSCASLASVLSSSSLTHLDLSDNDLQDSGVKLLCKGLSTPCRLQTLRLSGCLISERGGASLASVLSSSSLTHLDLSNNDLQDPGVGLLCEGLKSAPCRLETLRLSGCLISERGAAALASVLSFALSHLRGLDLSYNHPGPSAELLTTLWEQLGRPLDSLRLEPGGVRWLTPGLLKYYSALTLDENTVNECLQLSDDQRTVTSVREKEPRPEHPDRFEWPQVLSSSALTNRCYYEVQWSGGFVDIAVSYRGIRRRGERRECEFGADLQSWCLRVSVDGFSVRHNSEETAVFSSAFSRPPGMFSSGRVGVLLDTNSLSFFDVSSGKRVRLYTFNTVFMETVYAGFWLWNTGSSVTLVDMTQRPPVQLTGTASGSEDF